MQSHKNTSAKVLWTSHVTVRQSTQVGLKVDPREDWEGQVGEDPHEIIYKPG